MYGIGIGGCSGQRDGKLVAGAGGGCVLHGDQAIGGTTVSV